MKLISQTDLSAAALAIGSLRNGYVPRVLELLEERGALCNKDMFIALRCEQSEVSQACATLTKLGVVHVRQIGKYRYYSIHQSRYDDIKRAVGIILKSEKRPRGANRGRRKASTRSQRETAAATV